MPRLLFWWITLACLLPAISRAAEPPTWELKDGGRWVPSTAPTTAPISDETLNRPQQPAPGSELAENAHPRVADYYYADAQFYVAAYAYGAYIRSYPRSPYLARVKLRQAFSTLAQFRGVKFDATNVIDARQQL